MRHRTWLALAAAVLATGTRAAVPLAAFGHLPSVDLIAVSPDGSKVAMIVGGAGQRQLHVIRTAGQALVTAANVGDAKIRDLRWAGEDNVVVTRSTTADVEGLEGPRREYSMALVFNLPTRKVKPLLNDLLSSGRAGKDEQFEKLNTIDGVPMPRTIGGQPVVFLEGTGFVGMQGVSTLFRVDLDPHLFRTLVAAVGNEATTGWLVDADGVVVARTDYAQKTGRWQLFTGHGQRLVRVMEDVHPVDSPSLEGLGRTPGTVLVARPGDEAIDYVELPIGTAAPPVPVPALGNGSLVTDPRTGLVIGAVNDAGLKVDYTFLEPADAKLWAAIGRGFPDATVNFESWSDDRKTVVLRVEGKAYGAAFFLLDVPTHRAAWLANEYAEIDPEDLGDKQLLHYAAADGTDIPAYLTLPPGVAAPRGLPLVVLVHGGPGARDEPGFDWWAQALASRGYAVFQPQFRGSDGFGAKFLAAGFGEWGRKMQTDVSDGVAYLAKAGTIDPRRVAIVGGSYGGYAALAGVTLQHGIYRAAVSLAGPADLRLMLDYERTATGGSKNRTLRHWQRFMGAASPSDPVLATISPVRFAAAADAPVLLIHGADDTVVPFEQSKAMAAALTRAGKPVELVRLPGEDHYLSRSATRTAMLEATATFLARHLPVAAPAAAP